MKGYPTREQVQRIKDTYPVGTVIELISMEDPFSPIEEGTQGEIVAIDDMGTFLMKWQNGRSLGLVPFEDSFKVISKPEEQELQSPKLEIGGMSL